MVQLGCDMVTVQGGEGGGHTGAVPTTVLLPQVPDAVGVPVVAAGVSPMGATLRPRWPMAPCGTAMGTRFDDRRKPGAPAPKAAYQQAGTGDIVVSTKVDGLPQRMILNPLLQRIEGSGGSPCGRAIEAGLEMKRQTGMSWARCWPLPAR